jgi:superfamily II DNA/RNA helicase
MAEAPDIESFLEWDLGDEVQAAIAEMGITRPTPIQALAIGPVLAGKDVIAKAETGTGKTLAFGAPMLAKVDPARRSVLGLVLSPTRELAEQVHDVLRRLGDARGVKTCLIVGGEPMGPQVKSLQEGAQIVVGTPGRVLDLMNQGFLRLPWVEFAVLDEADKMLEIGFIDDVRKILEGCNEYAQTLLFSATFPPALLDLARTHTEDPIEIATASGVATIDRIRQLLMRVESEDGVPRMLARVIEGSAPDDVFLVFCERRTDVDRLLRRLERERFSIKALHGGYDQAARFRVMTAFRTGDVKCLLATDVASRGLDVLHVTHVVNIHVPRDVSDYTHRIGRTGRAGRSGTALTFVTPRDEKRLAELLQQAKGFEFEEIHSPRDVFRVPQAERPAREERPARVREETRPPAARRAEAVRSEVRRPEARRDGTRRAEVQLDEPLREEPKRERSRREEPLRDEPKRERSRREEPLRDEPKRERSRREEPLRDEPKRERSRREEPLRESSRREERTRAEPQRTPARSRQRDGARSDEPRSDRVEDSRTPRRSRTEREPRPELPEPHRAEALPLRKRRHASLPPEGPDPRRLNYVDAVEARPVRTRTPRVAERPTVSAPEPPPAGASTRRARTAAKDERPPREPELAPEAPAPRAAATRRAPATHRAPASHREPAAPTEVATSKARAAPKPPAAPAGKAPVAPPPAAPARSSVAGFGTGLEPEPEAAHDAGGETKRPRRPRTKRTPEAEPAAKPLRSKARSADDRAPSRKGGFGSGV